MKPILGSLCGVVHLYPAIRILLAEKFVSHSSAREVSEVVSSYVYNCGFLSFGDKCGEFSCTPWGKRGTFKDYVEGTVDMQQEEQQTQKAVLE